jgi:hypothetical protein
MLPWERRQPAEDPPMLCPAADASAEQPNGWTGAPLVAYLAARELLLPARLLGSGHQPLAFVMAHCCYLFAPIADLLGLTPGQGWAAWIDRVTALTLGLDRAQSAHQEHGGADGDA